MIVTGDGGVATVTGTEDGFCSSSPSPSFCGLSPGGGIDVATDVPVGVGVVEVVGGSVGVAIVGFIVGVGDGVGVTVGVEPVGGLGVGVEPTVGGLGVGVWGTEAGFSVGVGRGVGFALIEPAFNEGFVFIPTNSPVAGDANIPSNKIETTNTPGSRLIVTLPWG